jgi:hypothetical protein
MIEFHSDIHPHSYGISILLLIALIAILFLFIGAFSQSRRNAGQRAGQKAPPNGGPRSGPVGVCQRCRNALSVEAEYCARCGLPVTRPTPLPMPPQRTQPSHSRWLIYAAIALLGLVGFGAFWFMSESEPMPAPPTQQHAPSDAW